MLRAFVIAATLSGGAAHGLTPLPECTPVGAEAEAGISDYTASWIGSGFVLYRSYALSTGGVDLLILDDCRAQRRLTMAAEGGTDDANRLSEEAIEDAVQQALDSPQRYTMAQIRGLARDAGAKTVMGQASYVSCGCDMHGTAD